jgi:uncharacterized protein YndB with AHSA1/START domain
MSNSTNTLALALPSDTEIVMTRTFNAPPALVFEAITKPEHIRKWWGLGETNFTKVELDARVGGEWHFTVSDPQGNEWPFHGEFRELSAPNRIVFTQLLDVDPFRDKTMVVTIDLADDGGKTLMTETLTFDSKEDRDGMLESGMEGGASESLDRLEELLQTLKN